LAEILSVRWGVDAYTAVSDGQLFLRTSFFLWAIGDRKERRRG
jgi:hypothetical protein